MRHRAPRTLALLLAGVACAPHTSDQADTDTDPTDTDPTDTDPTDTDPTDTDTDVPPLDPGTLEGLVLWLDAGEGVLAFDGVVGAWSDLSPHGNDAGQSITYNRPTLVPDAIGGRPAVHFDMDATWGQFLEVPDDPTLRWGTGDFTLAVVVRYDNDAGNTGAASRFGTLWFKQSESAGVALHANSPGQTPTSGMAVEVAPEAAARLVSDGSGYDDLAGHVVVARRLGSRLTIRVDGVPDGSREVGVVDVDAPGVTATLGATRERIDATRLNGDIAEVLAVAGLLPDDDAEAIERYLAGKYGLDLR